MPATHERNRVGDSFGVEAAAKARLRQSSYQAIRSVSCEFDGRILTLSGRVPSYYLKQIAQTVAGRIEEVEQINNRLEVVVPSTWLPTGHW